MGLEELDMQIFEMNLYLYLSPYKKSTQEELKDLNTGPGKKSTEENDS